MGVPVLPPIPAIPLEAIRAGDKQALATALVALTTYLTDLRRVLTEKLTT